MRNRRGTLKDKTIKAHNKRNISGNCFLNFVLAGVLSVVFLGISFPFVKEATSIVTNEMIKIGGGNLNIVVLIFGILTGLTFLITFIKKSFKLTAIFLAVFWVIGLCIVLFLNYNNSSGNSNMYICGKKTPSTTKPEFERAISLVLQRHEQYIKSKANISKDTDLNKLTVAEIDKLDDSVKYNLNFYQLLNSYKNCIKVDYGKVGSDISGTFAFDYSSPSQELSITVSPQFEATDDLLTATLLSHELQHAYDYINIYPQSKLTEEQCFKFEENAFSREAWFLSMLNEQEKNSLFARSKLYNSEEINSLLVTTGLIGQTSEETTKAISDFVRQDSAYIKQCREFK